ncbi:uncharacterized protein LOC129005203 [Macrosteles quadrilineatus]|uniref:uncharacterized protein LOC129005203 n=1 Tax=Macrosteles quadrilineatus TaxID=74068 RepID=UPI0023E1BAFA|nr:uncharacterized protein LOC129005203 [Macrosteles quadrilineatus]
MSSSPGKNHKGTKGSKDWYTPDLGRLRQLMLLVHDHFKGATDDNIRQRYYLLYCRIKCDYGVKVRDAKRKFNADKILNAPNPCKAAWDIVNDCRSPCPGPEVLATPDDFNTYFLNVADELITNIPVLQTDPLDSVKDLTQTHNFNCWTKRERPRGSPWRSYCPTGRSEELVCRQ